MKNYYNTTKNHSNSKFAFVILLILLAVGNSNLFGQSLTLLSPNGGENWQSGTTQQISWELTGGPANLMLEISTDGGTYWNYLYYIPAEDVSGFFVFTPYYFISETALVRVSVYENPDVNDQSDSIFTISENPVYFYTPYAGMQAYQNMSIDLSWYCNFTTVNIDFSSDNGANWTAVATNIEGQNYEWITSNIVSDECIIKISDAEDNSVSGLSATFSLVEQPVATILSPNGGETWNYGELETVSWTGERLPYYLTVEYSTDGGGSWLYLGSANSEETGGSVDFYVPNNPAENAKIRLVDGDFGLVLDESDEPFTIYVPPVIMYYPYEGQEFYIKDLTYISWMATGIDFVNIELSTDSGNSWTMVEANVDSQTYYYYWTISGVPSETCLIKVSDVSNPESFGLSGMFTLLETPVITLNNPTGGEIWNTGTTHILSWVYDFPNASYVYLDFSEDNGQTWEYIGYGYMDGNQGSFEWTTPVIESTQCLVRVRDSYMNFVSDSSQTFTIRTFPETPICIVSVDSASNNNVIVWEKPNDILINTFIVYKETDVMDVYQPIGTVDYDSLALFIDVNSNPAVKSYRYKLGFSDAQGNIYPNSALHQTIHLSINQGIGNSWNLIWTDYLGFDVLTYNIYRSSNNAEYLKIATISSSFNSYTDIEAPVGTVYYLVEVVNENGCNLAFRDISFNNSISNIATNNYLSVSEQSEAIYASIFPNPASGMASLSLKDTQKTYIVQLVDLTGNIIFTEKTTKGQFSSEIKFAVSALSNGLYFVKISDGINYLTKKLVVQN